MKPTICRLKSTIFLLFGLLMLTSCGKDDNSDLGMGTGSEPDSYSHTRSVGASAADLLSSDTFTSLHIEIDYVSGLEPPANSLNNLKSFLEERLNKPGGITISLDDEIASPGIDSVSANQVYELEQEHRDRFTSGTTLTAYFLFLDNSYERENVLGIAYFNTSMAIFEETIRDNTGGLGQPSATTVESSVLMHEFGHILGLVDNGSPAVQDHVDEENGAHCDVESCLMYWAIQTTDLMGNLMGGSIPELDEQCLQDLQANGGK